MSEKILPNFLFVGAGKTGSTWIFKALDAHPEVYVPPAKELYFYSHHYDKGYDWYSGFFTPANEKSIALGELTPGYLYFKEAAEHIAKDLPGVKLFACLRNPIERAISAYQFKVRNGVAGKDFFSTMEKYPEILERGKYFEYVKMYTEMFGVQNFKVFLHDDLKQDPDRFGQEIYQFIGVDDTFKYVAAKKKVLAAAQPRSAFLAGIVYKLSRIAHGLGWIKLIGDVRNSRFSQLLYKPVEKQHKTQLNSSDKQRLIDYFQEDINNLEILLNRNLQHWLQ